MVAHKCTPLRNTVRHRHRQGAAAVERKAAAVASVRSSAESGRGKAESDTVWPLSGLLRPVPTLFGRSPIYCGSLPLYCGRSPIYSGHSIQRSALMSHHSKTTKSVVPNLVANLNVKNPPNIRKGSRKVQTECR